MGRKKVPERKKRNETIHASVEKNIRELLFKVDHITGEISFGHEVTDVYSELSYARPKGPKVLSRIPQSDPAVSFDMITALSKNFDFLCAVDTNDRLIRGKRVCVVAVVAFKIVAVPGASELKTSWQLSVPFALEYIGIHPRHKAEPFGWMAAHEHLIQLKEVDKNQRIGMVVDSELGSLIDINHRRQPVDGTDFLPEQLTLIYASADVGKENVLNRAIAVADSVSTKCLDAIESGDVPFNSQIAVDNNTYERARIIFVSLENPS